jgi:hypothetical protein
MQRVNTSGPSGAVTIPLAIQASIDGTCPPPPPPRGESRFLCCAGWPTGYVFHNKEQLLWALGTYKNAPGLVKVSAAAPAPS